MGLAQQVAQVFNAEVNSGNIAYATGVVATPASGAPGAYAKVLADATPTVIWWLTAIVYGNLSAAGATAFDIQVTRGEAGAAVTFGTFSILLEAAAGTLVGRVILPYPPMTAALSGAAARQTTASGKTVDVTVQYAVGVGS